MVKETIRRVIRKIYHLPLKPIYDRIEELERHALNRRHMAINEVYDYLVGAQVTGNYVEFGVYQGRTFSFACKRLSLLSDDMRFFAFDSFEGLPAPKGMDALNGYSSNFHEREFACTQEDFIRNLKRAGVRMEKVSVVKGWFDQTLKPENAKAYGIDKIAVAWIDCDLYESTVPILKFITPYLSVGSVILFDDWRCFRNSPEFGEQRACREWLAENPQISLRELFSFGWHGIAFTVNSV